MRAALAACVAFYITIGMFEAVWAILLRDRGASTWLIGLTLSLFTVPMIFLAPLGGRVAQQRGPMRVAAVSITLATLCTFSYGVLPSLWLLLAVSLIHAVADSFTLPANQVAAAMAAPRADASSGQGLLGATGLAAAGSPVSLPATPTSTSAGPPSSAGQPSSWPVSSRSRWRRARRSLRPVPVAPTEPEARQSPVISGTFATAQPSQRRRSARTSRITSAASNGVSQSAPAHSR